MHALQSLDVNVADVYFTAGYHMKTQIEHRSIGCLIGYRRVHLRKRVSLLLQRREQTRPAREHGGGNRGLS